MAGTTVCCKMNSSMKTRSCSQTAFSTDFHYKFLIANVINLIKKQENLLIKAASCPFTAKKAYEVY